LAVLVQDQYEVRSAEIPGFTQFGSEAFGLIYRFFGIRKALSEFIGEKLRAVQDMEKYCITGDLQSTAKKSCGLEIISDVLRRAVCWINLT
jgi:hypothetical protein